MSKADYDLDSGGSLMHIIQALIKPPEDDAPKQSTKKPAHSYYKRPGRGHNNDLCDACDEGGDLICCDRCPSSFHLGCHDPPLDEHQIPAGIWLCHNCRMTKPPVSAVPLKKQLSAGSGGSRRNSGRTSETSSSAASNASRPATPSAALAKPAAATAPTTAAAPVAATPTALAPIVVISSSSEGSEAGNSRSSCGTAATTDSSSGSGVDGGVVKRKRSSGSSEQSVGDAGAVVGGDELAGELDESVAVKGAFAELIRAASVLNPKQFELPRELNVFMQFPGSDKIEPCAKLYAKKVSRANSKRKSHELDAQGLVPLPAKTCFNCRRSCKKAPLVSCDYCTSFYHQDCLDPPLTALPSGLWMCPNHPEQFIDTELVGSCSATERIKLWSRFDRPIDQETIKAEFFRKVHSVNPLFRSKRRMVVRERVHIPAMVVHHYRHPVRLLPALRDVLRLESVFRGRGHDLAADGTLQRLAKEEEEEEEVQEEEEVVEGVAVGRSQSPAARNTGAADEDVQMVDSEDADAMKTASEPPAANSSMDVDVKSEEVASAAQSNPTATIRPTTSPIPSVAPLSAADAAAVGLELDHLDAATIKRLALQRLQEICHQNPALVDSYARQTTNRAILEALERAPGGSEAHSSPEMPSQLLSAADIERIAREFTGGRTPVAAEKEQPCAAASAGDDLKPVAALCGFDRLPTAGQKAHAVAARLAGPLRESRVRARAVLMPVDDILAGRRWFTKASMEGAVYMRFRQLSIGAGPGNDVTLRGDVCASVSAKHAVIFYDDITETFELINYSEFGTEVNGQLFSCDLTEHQRTVPAANISAASNSKATAARSTATADDPTKTFYANLRQIVDKRRQLQPKDAHLAASAKPKSWHSRMAAATRPHCDCRSRAPLIEGWEGSAILQHGTLLRFGCVPFVFATADE